MKKLFHIFLILTLLAASAIAPSAYALELPEAEVEFYGYLVRISDNDEPLGLMAEVETPGEQVCDNLYFAKDANALWEFAELGIITYCEPNYVLEVQADYTATHWSTASVNAQAAWNHTNTAAEHDMRGNGITVAVIDSGIYAEHSDLNPGNILPFYSLTESDGIDTWHGTFVAGVLSAQLNGIYTDGITPNVTILPICVTQNDKTTVRIVIDAIDYAISLGVDALNLSIGGTSYSEIFEEACQRAVDAGIIVVAAAGNYSGSAVKSPTKYMYPAAYDCVVSVSACTQSSGSPVFDTDYSYFNDQVTVAAPGSNIESLYLDGKTVTKSGTSFASPVVLGMAAIAKQQNSKINTDVFIALLSASSTDLGPAGHDVYYGHGLVNIERFAGLLTDEYNITFHLGSEEAGFDESVTPPTSYTVAADDISLPVPERDGYYFIGWYTDELFSGESIDTLVSGSFGNRDFYARWESADETALSSVTVSGYAAGWNVNANRYEITLPKNTAVSAADIVAIPIAGAVVSVPVVEDEGLWSFKVTSSSQESNTTYYLSVSYSPNSAPQISGTAPVAGTAMPASLDGKTAAVPYLAEDVSGWFEDADDSTLTIEMLTDKGSLSGTRLTYTPGTQDADSTVELSLLATDPDGFTSEALIITVDVGSIPVSSSTISGSAALKSDLYTLPDSLDIPLTLYGNTVSGVTLKPNNGTEATLNAGVDYVILEAAVGNNDAVSLSKLFLSSLNKGVYTLAITFSAGAPAIATLTVTDSTPSVKDPPVGPGGGGALSGGSQKTAFTITAAAGTGGSITPAGDTSVDKGDSMGYTITPDKGYTVSAVLVDSVSVGAPNSYTFTDVQQEHTIEAVFLKIPEPAFENPFEDVAADVYYFEAVLWAVENGVTTGTGEATFEPELVCTRAQVITFLHRAFGAPEPKLTDNPFADVTEHDYYYKAILWAVENGVTTGTGESTFEPKLVCTRAQVVTFLHRAFGAPEPKLTDNPFADITEHDYYYKAILWAVENGVTTGTGESTFEPGLVCTRAQVVTFLHRAMV